MSFSNYANGVPLIKAMNSPRGQIQVIFGPMFSGKTTELMRRLKRYTFAQYRCLIIRYLKDNRYSEDCIASHDGQTLSAISCTDLNEVADMVERFDVIGIDEGQFFQDSIINFAEDTANRGKIVIVAALDATFQRTEFGKILQLVPLAESVVKLNAICMSCFNDASFTKRISKEQEVEIIGGSDKYMSVCRECHRLSRVVKHSPSKIFPENRNGDAKFSLSSKYNHYIETVRRNVLAEQNGHERNGVETNGEQHPLQNSMDTI